MTLTEAAERVGVTPATLRRWIRQGLIPQYEGEWSPAAIGQARVVARMRERGHSLKDIRTATEEGRLAFGFLEELFPTEPTHYSLKDAARETGLDEGLVKRLIAGLGINREPADAVSEDELQLLRYVAAVLDAGLPAGGPAPARARLRSGDGAHRRRRGPAVSPLRPRAAHAVGRDRGGDGGADAGDEPPGAAAGRADPGPDPSALSAVLRRAGRRRAHGVRPRRHRRRPGPDAGGDRVRRPHRVHADDRGGGRALGGRRRGAVRGGGRGHAPRRGADHQDDRRRGDDHRLRRRRPHRLGGRLPGDADRAAAAADRRALRRRPVSRRRLLRARHQHRQPRVGALGRRRGARHPPGRRGGPGGRRSSRVRAHRRGHAQGLQRVHRGVHGAPASRSEDG